MRTVYLNMRTSQGVETVDEFTREQGQEPKEFNRYVNKMAGEYRLAGMNVYKSRRKTKDW
ncbi:MAG: hypothetical protein KDD03_13170 [Gelidibacter sp.]|nr:hypothetical protein [Gelidibacter sp.]